MDMTSICQTTCGRVHGQLFSAADPGRLVKIGGKINASKERDFLEENTMSAKELSLYARSVYLFC